MSNVMRQPDLTEFYSYFMRWSYNCTKLLLEIIIIFRFFNYFIILELLLEKNYAPPLNLRVVTKNHTKTYK